MTAKGGSKAEPVTLPLNHLRIMGFVLSCGAFIVGLYVFPKQCNLSFISPQKHFSKC